MAGIRYKGQIFSGTASFGDADDVNYDNTTSGLAATNVQDALDEIAANEGSFKHIASGDLQTGGDTFTFDFSDTKYARKLFVLFVTGGVYLINVWYGSAQLFTVLQTSSGTVALSGKTLTVTVTQNLAVLYGLYQLN